MAKKANRDELTAGQADKLLNKMDEIHRFIRDGIVDVVPDGTDEIYFQLYKHIVFHFVLQFSPFQEFVQYCADNYPEYLGGLDPFEEMLEQDHDASKPSNKFSGPDEKDRFKKKS